MISLIALDSVMPSRAGGGGVSTPRAPRPTRGRANRSIPGEFAHDRRRLSTQIAAMIYADAGIYLHEVEGGAGLFAARQAPARAEHRKLSRLLRSRRRAAGRGERQEMLAALTTNVTRFFREPHHFEHLQDACPAAAARGGAPGRPRAALVGRLLDRAGALFDRADAARRCGRRPPSHDVKILATDIDPHVVADGAGAASIREAALADVPAGLAQALSSTPVDGERGSWRVSDGAAPLVAFRTLNLNRRLADAGQVPRDLLPQRRDLFRRTDAAGGLEQIRAASSTPDGWLYIGHSERVTGPAAARSRSEGVTTYRLKRSGER